MAFDFDKALRRRTSRLAELVALENRRTRDENGVCERWENPVLTPSHVPIAWRFDLDRRRNPFLVERLGVACLAGAAAVERAGIICLVAHLIGKDGHSFFAVAESDSGTSGFRFRDRPVRLPDGDDPDAELGDMRLTAHEDGWLYGVFGRTRGPEGGNRFGIVRTRDLDQWERLADLVLPGLAQETVAMHPELVRGQYAFHVRAQVGSGAVGLGLVTCENVEQAEAGEPVPLESPQPVSGTPGAPPLRTASGWLHLAQSAVPAAAGGGSALTAFLTELDQPARVRAAPPGYWLAAEAGSAGTIACAGAVARKTGEVFVYYASGGVVSVASSSVERLVDYTDQEPAQDAAAAASQRTALVERNARLLARSKGKAYRGLRS